jgi:hypothetical protein
MSVSNTISDSPVLQSHTCIDQSYLFQNADPAAEGLLQALPCCCGAPAP